MIKKKSKNKIGLERKTFLLVLFTVMVFMLSIVNLIEAEEKTQVTPPKPLDTSKKVRLQVNLFAGGGSYNRDVGETTSGKNITLSAGGGLGGSLTFGYGLSSRLDIDLTAGMQNSKLSEKLANADGSFQRGLFLASLKYKIPLSKKSHAKIGAGVGSYMSGKWDYDVSGLSYHEIVEYDNATGFHIIGEYEGMFTSSWSWSVGVKYYSVIYKANSVTINGVSKPISWLVDDMRELNGSGFNLSLSLSKYF